MISSELLETVYAFLENRIDISELEDWIISREICFLNDPTSSDFSLVSSIELGFAEIQDGILTFDQFKNRLSDELQKIKSVTITDTCASDVILTLGANSTIRSIPSSNFSPAMQVIEVLIPA